MPPRAGKYLSSWRAPRTDASRAPAGVRSETTGLAAGPMANALTYWGIRPGQMTEDIIGGDGESFDTSGLRFGFLSRMRQNCVRWI